MTAGSPRAGRRPDGTPRRALVTGANGGIGRAIVQRLTDDGYEVVTMDVAGPADLVVDLVGDPMPTEALADIDVCISNAGVVDTLSPAHRMSAEKWALDIDVNLTGSFRVVQACLPGMRERRYGRIVLTSSVAAAIGARGQVAYCASKAGLIGMARAIASENVAHGITINCVLPGTIATPKVLAMPPEVVERVRDRFMPGGRHGEPEEVAGLMAYLASPEAGFVTAQSIIIDGGAHLGNVSLGDPGKGD
ncbi:SDR family oxidoreductase [Baekduia soli]|nr:SDR family NAD(P)-dependent oxidoreductase [Baekduia soli]